ncbi:biliverdin-producing heme oxygenase [Actomonas aquatica]|uniref:Biliverdin-producing heme oxygenase n=1 Tax=Actomonas aquatica TaxID=2866162 RepID=A0ABZ1CEN9_9BACT|nr:biliverdin-producing heme oxygenase [Opitutus sp. WL0086]WRQ89958.1 biliverdin-producing heme oxygenase [Opitutus sp. WL0086]
MIATLRESTAQIHRDLETQFGSFTAIRTPAAYARLLTSYRDLYAELYSLFPNDPATEASALSWQHDLSERLTALELDLCHLPSVRTPTNPPTPVADSPAPLLDSPAHQAGCLYVVEGSALGGLMLARNFAAQIPGLSPDALRFFSGSGPAAASARWRAFMAWLEHQPWTTAETTAAAASAVATFAFFSSRLHSAAWPERDPPTA